MTRFLALSLALSLAACANVGFVKTNASPRPLTSRPVDAVEVFTTAVPGRPYVEVGIVTARSESQPPMSKSFLIEKAMREAAKQGCDGLILASGSAIVAEGTCIVYK